MPHDITATGNIIFSIFRVLLLFILMICPPLAKEILYRSNFIAYVNIDIYILYNIILVFSTWFCQIVKKLYKITNRHNVIC